jgi:colanic acid biosynthesis glycosyl transferase WcaI
MHVLLVSNYFAPEGGAAAVRLTRLARQLHRRGHRITVLTSLPHYPEGRIREGFRGRFKVIEDHAGITVVQTWLIASPSPRISRKLLSHATFMLSAMLGAPGLPRPDVVLVEGQPVLAGVAGAFAARLKGCAYVVNVSDLWPDHLLSVGALGERHPLYRLARWVVDRVHRGAALIVAMSPRWAEVIRGHIGGRTPIEVIYNGVDLEAFRPGGDDRPFRARHGLDDRLIMSFIGTFSTQYDFELMLEVARHFQGNSRVQVVFIGQGSQEATVRAGVEGLDGVRWIPWLDPDEVAPAWNASALTFFAMRDQPLYRGTLPAKVFEAMASGVPMVAAMEGVGAELIETSGAGRSVACGDRPGLIRALEEVLADDARRTAYGQAARRHAETFFDAEQVADAYERVLLRAAGHETGATVLEQPGRR